MAGRRLRETIQTRVGNILGNNNSKVVIAGLSNSYTHYITTFEEYQKQRYEAASTIFGPYTLRAYQQQYTFLADKLARDEPIDDEGPHPPNLHDKQISLTTKVLWDSPPAGHYFGECIHQVSFNSVILHA